MNSNVKKSNGLYWLVLAVIICVLDIASKFLVHHTFELYESVNILPFFSITYVRNIGAAFSILEGQRGLLALLAIVISGFIIYLLYKNPQEKKLENMALSMVLGGALGNLFDRLYHGFVIDFFDVYFGTWHYPTFNIADCAICIGIGLFLYGNYKYRPRETSS